MARPTATTGSPAVEQQPPDRVGRVTHPTAEVQLAERLVMRTPRYADPDTPYMFHCHGLRHEDRGMMGQFVAVDQDEAAKAESRLRVPHRRGAPPGG